MSLSIEKVYQILDYLKENENCSIYMETGDIKISIVKGDVGAAGTNTIAIAPVSEPAHAATLEPVEASEVATSETADSPAITTPTGNNIDVAEETELVPVTAEVTSVFYSRPSPEEPPYVQVGDMVEEDSCVCLLEVMKLFLEVTAKVKGRIEKVLVNDGDLVQEGQAIFLIRPNSR